MVFQGVTIKASPWKVAHLAQLKKEGKLLLPDLQRGFVWSPERVRALLDSLYRRYPVGALLLWKPTWSTPEAPFLTRAWDISPAGADGAGIAEPSPQVQPGASFVLDGQQRLTSLFRVIFRSRQRGVRTADPELFVALSPDPTWADDPFQLRTRQLSNQLRDGLLVPTEVLFEGVRNDDRGSESLAIQNALRDWLSPGSPVFFEALDRANAIRNAILGAEIVAYEIDADAEDDNVIEIFARLNQQGVRLRPGDLAAARLTGVMKNFRERARQALSASALEGFSAHEGGEESARSGAFVDTDLLVRTALFLSTGVVRYRDVERRQNAEEAYARIERSWEPAVEGLSRAVAMYRKAGIPDGSWLPYRYLLLVPAVAEASGQRLPATQWLGWAIAASLWGHYGASAETHAQADAQLASQGRMLDLFDRVKAHARRVETLIPEPEDFVQNVPLESGVALALLVYLMRTRARSFPSGRPLGASEPVEMAALFPRNALDQLPYRDSSVSPDRLGNLALLSRADTEAIRGRLPREYLPECGKEELEQHGVPAASALWEVPRYSEFCLSREKAMAGAVIDLLRSYGVP
ncbi:MAG: DUF262 domain-containing protein [Myxococcales bacterium]|nr:DUF262 domain-containing protein [Myxococcales bacterium]